MKKRAFIPCITLLIIVVFSAFSCQVKSKLTTKVVIVGNVHHPTKNYSSSVLLSILEKIKPNVILLEVDSSFFTKDFRFKRLVNENEFVASKAFLEKYPKTQLRPFDFEGRNSYRKTMGIRPTDKLTINLLDSLNRANILTRSQAKDFNVYNNLSQQLIRIGNKPVRSFNNSKTDTICKKRQYYQYKVLLDIVKTRDEFASRFIKKPNGEQISYRQGYQAAADFWDLRNHTMAKHLLKIAYKNKGKTIVVLTGFMHRFYLLKELKRQDKQQSIKISAYYDE